MYGRSWELVADRNAEGNEVLVKWLFSGHSWMPFCTISGVESMPGNKILYFCRRFGRMLLNGHFGYSNFSRQNKT